MADPAEAPCPSCSDGRPCVAHAELKRIRNIPLPTVPAKLTAREPMPVAEPSPVQGSERLPTHPKHPKPLAEMNQEALLSFGKQLGELRTSMDEVKIRLAGLELLREAVADTADRMMSIEKAVSRLESLGAEILEGQRAILAKGG